MRIFNVTCLLLALALVACCGCTRKQTIKYDLRDVTRVKIEPLSALVFDIETLQDKRREIADNDPLFDQDYVGEIDEQQVCINSEKYYEKGTVAYQISKIMADHLAARGAFGDVRVDAKQGADYYLTGALKRFYARQPFAISAKNASVKEYGLVLIEFTDLEIHDKNGAVVRKLPNCENRFDEPMDYESYCWPIYWEINRRLKIVIGNLAEQMEKEVSELAAQRQAP